MTGWVLAAAAVGGLAAGRVGVTVAARFAGPRSGRFPLQELCTAGACIAVVARFGVGWALLPPLVAVLLLVPLASVDLRTYRLPDAINLPALGASLLAVGIESFASGHRSAVVTSLAAGAAYAAVMWVAHEIRPGALGFGDVKLVATLGVHLGWVAAAHHQPADAVALVAYSLLGACVIGLGMALAVGLLGRRGIDALSDPAPVDPVLADLRLPDDARADPALPESSEPIPPSNGNRLLDTVIPFGPALCAGAMAAVMASEVLVG